MLVGFGLPIVFFALLMCLLVVVILLRERMLENRRIAAGDHTPESSGPNYVRRPLLSSTELDFFAALRRATKNEYAIFTKVRLADLVDVHPDTPKDRRQAALNRITSKHIDFVVCDPKDFAVLFAIELDDKSHDRPKRKERDEFVNDTLADSAIPLVRFRASALYDPERIRNAIFA